MVHAGAEDRPGRARAGATVVLCPRSNLHIGGRLPDVAGAARRRRLDLALGTDSLASTARPVLWGELATLAAALPRGAAARAGWTPPPAGARALGLAALGALAPGKRPGLLDVLASATLSPIP